MTQEGKTKTVKAQPDRSEQPVGRALWIVALRGFPGEHVEVAAAFVAYSDANAYAEWWNREEVLRFGRESPVAATVEEIDFYPLHTWRPPARRLRVATDHVHDQ